MDAHKCENELSCASRFRVLPHVMNISVEVNPQEVQAGEPIRQSHPGGSSGQTGGAGQVSWEQGHPVRSLGAWPANWV